MNINPADHVDPAAFQPSHTLSVEILPGSVFELFEDIKAEDVGKVSLGFSVGGALQFSARCRDSPRHLCVRAFLS
jgi:hypothetical protein